MKTWIRRTLIGLAATTVLLGGLAACSHGGRHGHGSMSEADVVQLRARFIDKAASKLDLDAAQKARLATLADALQAQRSALLASGNPRTELQALVAGTSFDRARAQALVDGKTTAVRDKAPAVVGAMADFYDSLKPEQQQKLRDMLAKGRRWG
jgi:Spy/CpxP family protein refolding chaperone